MGSPPESIVRLTEYQRRWVADRARFKLARWARQTGKTFAGTLEPALDMAEAGAPWVLLSSGERASRENVEMTQRHLHAIGAGAQALEGYDVFGEATYKVHELRLPNGGRLIGLPANPDTARGHSANVVLDEFAFHRDSRKIWAALFPTITRGWRIRVLSTPQGKQNKFYDLSTNPEYAQHVLTIWDAVAQGLELRDETGQPTSPAALRAGLDDEEAWLQEYEVQFLDEATAWLSYELIAEAEDDALAAMPPWAQALVEAAQAAHARAPLEVQPLMNVELPSLAGEAFVGLDIGRRRDLTVIWLLGDRGPAKETVAAIDLARQPFGVQERVLWTLLARLPVRRADVDQSGLGMQLAERAIERFGAWRVEGITFTGSAKEALAVGLKTALEDRRVRIPVDRRVRESLHSLKRFQTATGNFRFDADRSETTGHADHAWALALALQAAAGSGAKAADVGEPEEEPLVVGVGPGGFTRGQARFWGRGQ
jgi:phage FluMu gp28-like protein